MKAVCALLLLLVFGLILFSCAPSGESAKHSPSSSSSGDTKEGLFRIGHALYAEQKYDSATIVLGKVLAIDSSHVSALSDLAQLHYQAAMGVQGRTGESRREDWKRSFSFYARLESLGNHDADTYERLCELANNLNENKKFLVYAEKNARQYPYDRQYYHLGLAYGWAGDHQNVIRTQKEAIEKFPSSPFVAGFYRQLGEAYLEADRHQTAEKAFAEGVEIANARVAELEQSYPEYKDSAAYRRLIDDRISMLLSLKKLHKLYNAKDKLEDVERQLRDAG